MAHDAYCLHIGQNFAIACSEYKEGDRLTVLQFVGGLTGQYIKAYLDERKIHHISVMTNAMTRTCTTVLNRSDGSMTELIEPSGRIDGHERQAMEKILTRVLTGGSQKNQDSDQKALEGIALCGESP